MFCITTLQCFSAFKDSSHLPSASIASWGRARVGAAFRGLLAVSPAPLSSRPVPALVSALPDMPPLPAVVFRWGALPAVGVNRCSPPPQRAVGGSVPLPQLSGQTHSARNTARGAGPPGSRPPCVPPASRAQLCAWSFGARARSDRAPSDTASHGGAASLVLPGSCRRPARELPGPSSPESGPAPLSWGLSLPLGEVPFAAAASPLPCFCSSESQGAVCSRSQVCSALTPFS